MSVWESINRSPRISDTDSFGEFPPPIHFIIYQFVISGYGQSDVLPLQGLNIFHCVQGRSSKFAPHAQKVSLSHQVQDEDVVSSTYLDSFLLFQI